VAEDRDTKLHLQKLIPVSVVLGAAIGVRVVSLCALPARLVNRKGGM
jgi:hypothetical protein